MLFKEIRHDDSLSDLERGCCLGSVVGVYERCFHLLLQDQRLVTVFGEERAMMPMSICTNAAPARPFVFLRLREGAEGRICNGLFSIPTADFHCRLGGTAVSLRRDAQTAPKSFEPFERALLRAGKRCGSGKWLPQWIGFLRTGSPLPGGAVILRRFADLLRETEGGGEGLDSALMALVGMGDGLTPSADDMICGGAAAAWLWWPEEKQGRFLKAILEFCEKQGKERTTLLSCQQLMQTARGELSDPLYDLAVSLSCGSGDLDGKTKCVAEYGGSSGTELCMGLLAGLYAAAAYCGGGGNREW